MAIDMDSDFLFCINWPCHCIKDKGQTFRNTGHVTELAVVVCVCVCAHTVEGLEVDGKSVSLAVTFTTLPTHIRPVAGVCPHMTRQFN